MKSKKGSSLIAIAIILLIVIAIGIVIFVVVNNNKTKTSDININEGSTSVNQEQTNTTNTEKNPTNIQNNNNTAELSGRKYKVPMENIYIEVPNWQEIEEGLTELFIIRKSKYVAITANWKEKANSVQNSHQVCFEKLKLNMENYQGGVNSLKIISDETININGIEMYKFEGTINYGKDTIYDGYAIGYSFILEGIPCEIVGSVIDKSQSEQLIKELKDTVNAMVTTVKTTEQ